MLGIVYSTLVAKPRRKIEDAVDHLMYLKVIFLGYLRQLHQADQAYTRRLLEADTMSIDDVSQFSRIVRRTMDEAVEQLTTRRQWPGHDAPPASDDREPSPQPGRGLSGAGIGGALGT